MPLDVLLLEDDPSKKNKLLSLLNGEKNLFGKVDTAICTADAVRLMTEKSYDLLIADVVVPSELGGEKSEDNCIAMLEQIDDGFGAINRPSYTVAVSASSELTQDAHEFFRGRPWGIVPYVDDSQECIRSIESISRFVLSKKEESNSSQKCDILIISALIEPEFSAIEELPLAWSALEPLDDLQMIRFGSLESNGRNLKIAAVFCSRMGPVAASVLTVKSVLMLHPAMVIMAGICAGIPGKASIGDVVAADVSWDWQSGKYVDKMGVETFEIAPHQIVLDEASKNKMLLLKRDAAFWNAFAPLAIKAKVDVPRLVIGPMASGSSVLADARVADRIKKNQHKNVTGLDMETYGVFAAVASCDPKIRVLSLKSVCDKGDVKKNDKHQSYAAKISAETVMRFIEKYAVDLI